MNFRRYIGIALCVFVCLSANFSFAQDNETLFQVSTIDALLNGVYEGSVTCGDLKKHGDLGIGTFDGLDGEMVVYGGTVYQVRYDGSVKAAADTETTPFAAVTHFDKDMTVELANVPSLHALYEMLDRQLPTTNIFYAIRVEGEFDYLKTRSVPGQQKPYPPLVEVVKKQSVFEFHNRKGVIVGFRCPGFVKGVNVPGYHLHFLTDDRTAGGHLLDVRARAVKIAVDLTPRFTMVLPQLDSFYAINLNKDRQKELDRVEK
jgi:acetolactate decarboxylase